jgi:hypothetical protein|tara:strand:+ start:13589 stop:13795 length:207 start_codon:yes stop_codon:yes gene_type:complete
MDIEKIKNVLENYSKVPNKDLADVMVFLKSRFDESKNTVIQLTHQMDELERDYNKLNTELKKRVNTNA